MLGQLILNGLVTGLLLALPSLALTIVFGVLKFPNFAVGATLTFGAYAAWVANHLLGMPLIAATAVASLFVAGVTVLCDKLIFERLRDAGSITLLVASLGFRWFLKTSAGFRSAIRLATSISRLPGRYVGMGSGSTMNS